MTNLKVLEVVTVIGYLGTLMSDIYIKSKHKKRNNHKSPKLIIWLDQNRLR